MRLALLAAALTASASAAFAGQPTGGGHAERGSYRVILCEPSGETGQSWVRECSGVSGPSAERATFAGAERAPRQVFVCNRSAETRKSWVREYGEITFVTADELARAAASNESWATPRCMTSAELHRFAEGRPEAAEVARAINAVPSL